MIGTSDGEQFDSSFEEIAARKTPYSDLSQARFPTKILPSQFPPAPGPNEFEKKKPVGSILPHGEQILGLSSEVKGVLSLPHIQEAIANPKIDRSHDVPYEAGASSKPNDFTTHIDKSIPTSVSISGKTFDPAVPANIHEQVEREVMNNLIKKGMTNQKAYEIAHHEFAEPAEDAWYKAHGIDINEVNKQWAKWDKGTEQEKATDKSFPPDLYKKPYPHNEVEGVKHEPSGVASEWASSVGVDWEGFKEGLRSERELIMGFKQPTKEQLSSGEVQPPSLLHDVGRAVQLGMMAMGPGSIPKPTMEVPPTAKQAGFDTPTFHGSAKPLSGSKIEGRSFYSTTNPELANKYADDKVITPLVLNTKNYHTVDAGQSTWAGNGGIVMDKAIRHAIETGKDGVIVRNIYDEPLGATRELPPQDVYISLNHATVRSWFAKFDPAKMHLNDLLASGLAVAVPAGTQVINKEK